MTAVDQKLEKAAIRATPQRRLVAEMVLVHLDHPSAEEVFRAVCEKRQHVSQATVYNTLNLLVEAGLLKQVDLGFGHVIYDCNTEDHHHFIDEASGQIRDVNLQAVTVSSQCEAMYNINSVQTVIRGTVRL